MSAAAAALRNPLALGALAGALALCACSKIEYLPDEPLQGWSPTVVLMHRGGGSDCGDRNTPTSTQTPPCWANTLPAVLHGFATLDGAEVDVQMSADGTLWLGHDNETYDCGNAARGCFQDLHDGDIAQFAYCDWNTNTPCTPDATNGATCVQHYVTVAGVFERITSLDPSKRISLDIKGQYCRSLGISDAQHIGDQVDELVRRYAMDWRVFTETDQLAFLSQLTSRGTPVWKFVNSLGDVDGPLTEASRQGADGISFKAFAPESEPMNASVVAGIHAKGARIILWTIDTPTAIADAWASTPDVIETDEPSFFQCVASPSTCPAAP